LPADDALRYLRRQDISLPDKPLGFALMTFEGLGLGWAKNLGNRVNNYYPTEWRIRN
jgi:NOL1/NOP2/fmu family ribosome biogenesis protein